MKGWLVFKRFVWGVILIPFFMAGCVGKIDETVMHDVELTQTARAYTPIPRPTPHPSERPIVEILNAYLQIPDDPLSSTIDASYRVVGVTFPPNPGGVTSKFIITVECECARNGDCCNVEHAFVVIVRAMKANTDVFLGIPPTIPSIIPDTVAEFQMECFDHNSILGMMNVPWSIMRDYLAGVINGEQFGWEVKKNKTPEP